MNISFRPVTDQDIPFLYELYASTRADEMAIVADWTAEQKEQFVQQQFMAQHTYYQDTFKEARWDIILLDDWAIGRLYVDRRPEEIRLIDITLSPQVRKRGIGSVLLKDLINEATDQKKTITIHVEHYNPAMRLYERLGFTKIEDQGVYDLMEWRPSTVNKSSIAL